VRPRSLDKFLRDARVPYTTFTHKQAFTAQDEAAVSHVPGRSWAKVVVCFADDEAILAVVPAPFLVDLEQLRELAGARALRLAREQEFQTLYPDCELGAMAPFGTPFPQRVFVDRSLVGEPEMVFNAGTHTDAIRMHYCDFADVVRPVVGAFGRLPTSGAASVQIHRSPGPPEFV
jgi:Ala-tRNA(Pro) deacylase